MNNWTRRGVPRIISMYPDDNQEIGLFPYIFPKASIIPNAKPHAKEIKVNNKVI